MSAATLLCSPNEMKWNSDTLAAVAGLIAQVGIGYGLWIAHWEFQRHWSEILAGATLPQITVLSLAWMRAVPLVAAALLLIGLAVPTLRKCIVWYTLGVALAESLILTILMMGLCFPAMTITYRLT